MGDLREEVGDEGRRGGREAGSNQVVYRPEKGARGGWVALVCILLGAKMPMLQWCCIS